MFCEGGTAKGQPTSFTCSSEPHLLCLVCDILHSGCSMAGTVRRGYPMVYLSVIICGERYWKAQWQQEAVNKAEVMRSLPSEEVDSFCLQIQDLNPHQCNTRLLQATD